MPSFSQRHGYSSQAKEITIREEAPESLRVVVLEAARKIKLAPSDIRSIICPILRKRPDPNNWSDYPNIWDEVQDLVHSCEWFKVYDIIEAILETGLAKANRSFESEINQCFLEEGIGWQILNGGIVTRGDDAFESAVKIAASHLRGNERPTAASHIQSALRALSERPRANTAGAVAHATSSVECVLNDITGVEMTLGKYLDKHPQLFHPALKKSLDGIYGYASDAGARHGREGKNLHLLRRSSL